MHQLQVGQIYTQDDSICGQSGDLTSSDESFSLQVKVQHTQAYSKVPTPHHVITNLAFRLKPHQKRNQYPRARLDTCADVNIMPASFHKLVFQDPDCKTLAPSKLEIGTYTTNTVTLVGSCVFYLVNPYTKYLQEVAFYVASNNSSVLLSCATTLALGLIQPGTRLDYHLPEPALLLVVLTSQRRLSLKISVHVSKKESKVLQCPTAKVWNPKLITSKEQILSNYSDVFDGIGCFPDPHSISRSIPVSHPSKPMSTNPNTSKRVFQKRD